MGALLKESIVSEMGSIISSVIFSSFITHFNVTFLCVLCLFTPLPSAFYVFLRKENYQNLHRKYVLGETKVRSTGLRSTMDCSSHSGKNWYCPPTYLKRPPPNGKLSKLSEMFLLFKEKYEKFSPVARFLYFFFLNYIFKKDLDVKK